MQMSSMIRKRMKIFRITWKMRVNTRNPMAHIAPVSKASILTLWNSIGSISNLWDEIRKFLSEESTAEGSCQKVDIEAELAGLEVDEHFRPKDNPKDKHRQTLLKFLLRCSLNNQTARVQVEYENPNNNFPGKQKHSRANNSHSRTINHNFT